MMKSVSIHHLSVLLTMTLPLASGTGAFAETTAGQVVARCAEAMGGASAIDGIKTIRLRMHYPDHEYLVTSEIWRPNRVRTEGKGRYVLVFDGLRAAYLDTHSQPQKDVQVFEGDMVRDMEVDIGYYFPAFFDHPAEYLGEESLQSGVAHKLLVKLPLGAEMTYLVDATSHLPVKVTASVAIQGEEYTFERSYLDYQEVGGFTYFKAFTYPTHGDAETPHLTATIESLEFNPPLDEARFDPAALR
jgi:hypothetical protein